MKIFIPALIGMLAIANASAAAPATCSVTVGKEPVVMRMSKDEFRIVFAVSGDDCSEHGCAGIIKYQATWRTEDGAGNVDSKALSYAIPSGSSRSIAVDRHYFDLGEGKHKTDLVNVSVEGVSCAQSRLTAER
jgi:hypothetical protein